MKTLAIAIFLVFLAMVARPQGMVVTASYDANSIEGDFFGTWSYSFSTNDFTPSGTSGSPPNVGMWSTASCMLTFTDVVSGCTISLNFQVGGIDNNNEFGFRSSINVNDPAMGSIYGGIGDGGGSHYQEATLGLFPGQSTTSSNNYVDNFFFYSWSRNLPGNGQVNQPWNNSFNGISGTGGGTWAVTYPVPEPAVISQMAVGGLGLCLARYFHRRRE